MKLEDRPGIKKLEKAVNINWVKIAVLAVLACLCIKYSDHVIETIRLIVYTMRPLFYGLAIAYVLNIFMKKLEKIYYCKLFVYRTDFGYFFYLYALWKRTAAVPAEKACNGLCGGGDYRTGTAFSDSCK